MAMGDTAVGWSSSVQRFIAITVLGIASSTSVAGTARAQWMLQGSHTTAELRGIDSVGHGVAWASGSGGTVLRTLDDGKTWQPCAVPSDAAKLDFRGVQAFDSDTAIVMSSGPGEASRLYKTSDGCKTWRMVFMNPDRDGFWDALQMQGNAIAGLDNSTGVLVGDPVGGKYAIFVTGDGWNHWQRWGDNRRSREDSHVEYGGKAPPGTALFAASNGTLLANWMNDFVFVTGGQAGASIVYTTRAFRNEEKPSDYVTELTSQKLDLVQTGAASGAFAVATAGWTHGKVRKMMVVGGAYDQPNAPTKSLALVLRGFKSPMAPRYKVIRSGIESPQGYRSAVAFDGATSTWVTVGPNGTDVSTDDGRSWRALKPAAGDAPNADQQWNAISLPFVVGPKGRIGRLKDGVLRGR